jgi:glycosyltransferase involved in cell wall biosynthesis
MTNPEVSIIIPTYNAEKHLNACLKRIEEQDLKGIRVIVIDGGSTDRTIEIIKSHQAIISHWQSEPDLGIYDAMNKGTKFVYSGWILFLGADDLLEIGFKSMVAELKDPQGIYYGMVDVNNVIYKDPYSNYRLAKLNICHQAIFYPMRAFSKHQYNLKYKLWADWFLNIECWKDSDFKFIYKPYLISKFGTTGVSSTTTDKAFEADRRRILMRYFGIMTWLRYAFKEFKADYLKFR